MAQFPVEGYVESNARTEGELKQALADWLAATKQLPGGLAETTLTIVSGSVTATRASHKIDTEASAASDDLTNIVQTNLPDGSYLTIRCAASGRTVIVKHAAGGAGQISLRDGTDLALTDPVDTLWLRRDGALWQEVNRHRKADTPGITRGHIVGLTVSNNTTDVTNDLDVAGGEAASEDALATNRILLALAGLTKRIDETWAAGTDVGMRDSADNLTGAKTFHLYLFRRAGGADDVFASTSLTPSLPDGGTKMRRIGSRRWSGSAWDRVVQTGKRMQLSVPANVVDASPPGGTAAVTRTLAVVPTGIVVDAIITAEYVDAGSSVLQALFTSLATTDTVPAAGICHINKAAGGRASNTLVVTTNASAQIRSRQTVSNGDITLRIMVEGWYDNLGEHA